jgi:hypothetical protein
MSAVSSHSNVTTLNKTGMQFFQNITLNAVLSAHLSIVGQKHIKHEYNVRDMQRPLHGTPATLSYANVAAGRYVIK